MNGKQWIYRNQPSITLDFDRSLTSTVSWHKFATLNVSDAKKSKAQRKQEGKTELNRGSIFVFFCPFCG
jgi:hypothetical protein